MQTASMDIREIAGCHARANGGVFVQGLENELPKPHAVGVEIEGRPERAVYAFDLGSGAGPFMRNLSAAATERGLGTINTRQLLSIEEARDYLQKAD